MPEWVSVCIRAWAPFIAEAFSGLALISTLDPTVFIASAFIQFVEYAGSNLVYGVSPPDPFPTSLDRAIFSGRANLQELRPRRIIRSESTLERWLSVSLSSRTVVVASLTSRQGQTVLD